MQGEPRGDREWEHWPGRRQPDDGIKHRLMSLFTPTEQQTGDVEALIAERGRELEARTQQLASTIADLERREESARRLRIAVEEMLRRGSAELDDRNGELNALAAELAGREAALLAAEQDLEERRRELGAVELRRAAVERREATAQERETELESVTLGLDARRRELEAVAGEMEQRLTRSTELEHALTRERETLDERQAALADTVLELESRVAELTAAEAALSERERALEGSLPQDAGLVPQAPAETASSHLLLVPADRYRLEEHPGPSPARDAVVETEWGTFRVLRLGPSPYPGDPRRCAFLEPLSAPLAG